MKVSYVFVILAVLLAVPMFVDAATVRAITATCGFVGNPGGCTYACGVNATFRCTVNDSTAPGATINYVALESQDLTLQPIAAAPTSGNSTVGVWEINVTPNGGGINIDAVELYSSTGTLCHATGNLISDSCKITFNTATCSRIVNGGCNCQYEYGATSCTGYEVQQGSSCCGADDVLRTTSRSLSADCALSNPAGLTAEETYGVCQYCDPGWYATSGACQVNPDAPDPTAGVSLLSFSKSNPACCAVASQPHSYCQPPPQDQIVSSCNMDDWTTYGHDIEQSKNDWDVNRMSSSTTNYSLSFASGTGMSGVALRPLVADLDADGFSEVYVFTTAGVSVFSSVNMRTSEYNVSTGYTRWVGQPSLWGLYSSLNQLNNGVTTSTIRGTAYPFCSNTTLPNSLLCTSKPTEADCVAFAAQGCAWVKNTGAVYGGFAGLVRDSSGDDHFVSYNYTGSSYVKIVDVNLWTTYSDSVTGGGVSCIGNTVSMACYFSSDSGYMYALSAYTGAQVHARVNLNSPLSVSDSSAKQNGAPVLMSFGYGSPAYVATVGVMQDGVTFKRAVYVCTVALTNCTILKLGDYPSSFYNVSSLTVGPYQLDGTMHGYVATIDGNGVAAIYRVVFSSLGAISLTSEPVTTSGSSTGITEPVVVRMDGLGAGSGVAFGVCSTQSAVTSAATRPTLLLDYNAYRENLSTVANFEWGRCSGKYCYMRSSSSGEYYVSKDSGQPFTQITGTLTWAKSQMITAIGTAGKTLLVYNVSHVVVYDANAGTWSTTAFGFPSMSSTLVPTAYTRLTPCSEDMCQIFLQNVTSCEKYIVEVSSEGVVSKYTLPDTTIGCLYRNVDPRRSLTGFAKTDGGYYVAYQTAETGGSLFSYGYLVYITNAGVLTSLGSSQWYFYTGLVADSSSSIRLLRIYKDAGHEYSFYYNGSTPLNGKVVEATESSYMENGSCLLNTPGVGRAVSRIQEMGVADGGVAVTHGSETVFYANKCAGGTSTANPSYSSWRDFVSSVDAEGTRYWRFGVSVPSSISSSSGLRMMFKSGGGVYPAVRNTVVPGSVADRYMGECAALSSNCVPWLQNAALGGPSSDKWGYATGTRELFRDLTSPSFIAVIGSTNAAVAGGSGDFVQYGWRADATGSFASPTYEGVVQVASSGVCPYSLAAQDVDGNGLSELVTAKEIVSSDGTITSLTGGSVSGSSVVVDVNADSYADLIYVTLTGLKARLSIPSAMALVSTETRVGGVRCTYSASENKITAIATQVSAVNPNSLLFSGEVRRDGQVVGTVSATQSNFIEFSPSSGGGQYQMKVIVEDTQEASSASATCNVTVPSTVSVANDTCSLAPDGEFNFATFSTTQWFTNILSSRAPGSFPALSGGIAKFTSPLQSIGHVLSCKAAALSVNVGLVDMTTPTGAVTVSMREAGIDGASVDVASFLLVHQTGLWASDSTGSPVFVGAVGSGRHNITIVLYVDQQKYTVSLDGVGLKTLNFMNEARGAYSGVAVTGGSSGQLNVDFIKTYGSGAQRDLVETTGKESLKGCVMNATYNKTQVYYDHVSTYCANTLTKEKYGFDTVCNADALMAAVKYNSECYKEAFNYCIDQTYPLEILKESSGTRGMDGATVCSTLLTGGSLLDKIVTPIWSVLWNYVAKNAILVFSILFLVIIVATLSGKRK